MPFSALVKQSVEWHLSECMEVDRSMQEECPMEEKCDCTIAEHYLKFLHLKLAAIRAGKLEDHRESANAEINSVSNDNCKGVSVIKLEQTFIDGDMCESPLPEDSSNGKKNSKMNVPGFIENDDFMYRDLNSFNSYLSCSLYEDSTCIQKCKEKESEIIVTDVEEKKGSTRKSPVPTGVQEKNINISAKHSVQASITNFFQLSNGQKPKVAPSQYAVTVTSTKSTCNVPRSCQKGKRKRWRTESSSEQDAGYSRAQNCPFYKKIPGTAFTVDAFNYGTIPGVKCYFLSHFHWDHYHGLSKYFKHPIYCSKITANLVSLKIRVAEDVLHPLPLNIPSVIEDVEVILLDANHCPGSVMFLFRLRNGQQYLHCGDFRANPEMEAYPSLMQDTIHRVYLDTTYCDPEYDFPPQGAILDYVTHLALKQVKRNEKVLFVCGSYTIGKEKVFVAVAEALDCKIWANREKQKVLQCLEDKSITSRLVSNWMEAQIHVLPMNSLNPKALHKHLDNFKSQYNEIVALKPTGWEHTGGISADNLNSLKPRKSGSVSVYGIPYSEHSSFSEMKHFIQFLKPQQIIPTVNVGKPSSRMHMKALFQEWLRN
ncbi:uncharacterized protein LOC143232169 [Tachypleus tridentatus]|uniref:uncharacterized protein LOC143232169 n=1 Tax=Tachypleus tridentatus TaxID=6853 RepID=UPI003FD111BA